MNRRIVIIGGVAGGMSAATRARRMNEHARIIVIERGGYISFANCGLPYYIGGAIKDAHKLLVTDPQRVKQRFNIDVRVRHEATGIDRAARTIDVQDLNSGRTFQLEYDKLILAPGAVPIVPAIAHVDAPNVFALRSMDDTRAIDQWIGQRQPRRAVVIGAGFVGLEMVEALHQRGMTVTVVEKMPHPLPPLDQEMAAPIAAELARHDVKLIVGSGLKALEAGSDGLVSAVEVEDGRVIPCDLVVMSIGVRPNVKLAQQAGLRIGSSGAIAVDCVQRTSDPDIYAVGDASEVIHAVTDTAVRIPLAGPANRQGRVAGEHAATGQALPAGKVLGTAIMKLFDLTVGITGLCERAARQAGFAEVDSAYVLPAHHAGYYPGAQQMRIKLVYDNASGRVLGAQIVGGAGVDKRLDVIATAMHFRGTIDDLASLDLAYAPPFGSAKDAVHMAAFVAQNQRRGLMRALGPESLHDQQLIDVRTPEEFAAGTIRGAINIPLDELRQRHSELDPSRPTVVMCQVGLRGYVAQRMLEQLGFAQVKNLKGGFTLTREVLKQRVTMPRSD